MTVNERLYFAGLYDAFYEAINEKNVAKVIEILEKIGLTEQGIVPILRQVFPKTRG